jgi:hypothetical protein
MHHRLRVTALATCAVALALPAAANAADTLYGVTDDDELVTINSSAPGNLERSVNITGLPAGEKLLGIDVRPATDALLAVGSTNRLYQLNPVTGVARLVGSNTPFTPGLTGTSFGFDVNPQVDAVRIVSDADQNLRVSANTGQVIAADTNLAYKAGDPGAGTNPSVGASAYTNSVPAATSTALYGIDSARDALVRQDPPNAGTLTTVGALGVDTAEPVAFDITAGGVAYAALQRAGQSGTELFTVNLATGKAAGAAANPTIGTKRIRALAAAGSATRDTTAPVLSVAFSSTQLEQNLLRRGLVVSASCNEDCTIDGRLSIGGRTAGTVSGQRIAGVAGRRTIRIALSSTARATIRRRGTSLLRLRISANDSAGNRKTQTRFSRTQTLGQRRAG